MKTYIFNVSLEPDEDGWRAFYPPLESIGASTWGKTQEEALQHIHEVLAMIIEEFI
jgi:predicted RNase H-like HicB family nuclease